MPSMHAQFMALLLLYVLLRMRRFAQRYPLQVVLLNAALVVATIIVCYGRVYLMAHTTEQVLVGLAVGMLHAIVVVCSEQLLWKPTPHQHME